MTSLAAATRAELTAARAKRLRLATFEGPFVADTKAAGLILDSLGRSLALALPVFSDPADRTWFARELADALNTHFGTPSRLSDPFDPPHEDALRASSRHFEARVGHLPKAAE